MQFLTLVLWIPYPQKLLVCWGLRSIKKTPLINFILNTNPGKKNMMKEINNTLFLEECHIPWVLPWDNSVKSNKVLKSYENHWFKEKNVVDHNSLKTKKKVVNTSHQRCHRRHMLLNYFMNWFIVLFILSYLLMISVFVTIKLCVHCIYYIWYFHIKKQSKHNKLHKQYLNKISSFVTKQK